MIRVLRKMLRRWRRPPAATRGMMLREAMRSSAAGEPPGYLDSRRFEPGDLWELFERPPAGVRGHAPVSREMLRDGTPYDESGADENDWRL